MKRTVCKRLSWRGRVSIRIPNHIGIIPDGNRRWAAARGLPKRDGYGHGLEPGLSLLRHAAESGVSEVSYYGFTTDNCKRPRDQQEAFARACVDSVRLICNESVSLLVLGNAESDSFPRELLPYTERRVNMNGGGTRVNFLVNYGWEWDLAELGSQSSRQGISGALRSHDVSRVDLIVRWGGMRRLSGFLPVQSVYADFYVVDDYWPDFAPSQLADALAWYDKQDVTLGG